MTHSYDKQIPFMIIELDKLTQEYLEVVIGRIHFEATCGGSQPLNLKAWTHNSRR